MINVVSNANYWFSNPSACFRRSLKDDIEFLCWELFEWIQLAFIRFVVLTFKISDWTAISQFMRWEYLSCLLDGIAIRSENWSVIYVNHDYLFNREYTKEFAISGSSSLLSSGFKLKACFQVGRVFEIFSGNFKTNLSVIIGQVPTHLNLKSVLFSQFLFHRFQIPEHLHQRLQQCVQPT